MNKKKIISQLASVTLLTSTLIATAGTVNPDLVSVRGEAEQNIDIKELKEIEGGVDVSGTLKPLYEQTHYGHRDNISFDVKVNKKVKKADAITLKLTNLDGLVPIQFNVEVKNKDGVVVGFITDNYYYNGEKAVKPKYLGYENNFGYWDNSTLFKAERIDHEDGKDIPTYTGRSEDVNKGIYKELKIVFNENAENYDSLDLHFEAINVYSQTILTNFDRTINYKMEYGNKTIFENSYFVKGVKKENENRKAVTFRMDRGINQLYSENGRIFGTSVHINMDINGEHGLKKGDKVTLKVKPNSNFKFKEWEYSDPGGYNLLFRGDFRQTNGTILDGNDFGIDDNGVYYGITREDNKLKKVRNSSFKLLKSTPDEIVLELLDDYNYVGSVMMYPDILLTTLDNYDSNKNILKDLNLDVKIENQNTKRLEEFHLTGDLPVSITNADFSSDNKIRLRSQVGEVVKVGDSGTQEKAVGRLYYITQWISEDENEFLKPSIGSTGIVTTIGYSEEDKIGFFPAGTIEGYEFVRTDTNTNTNTQTHVFRKIKAEPVKELKTISKDENGLVIKTEKGSGSPTDLSGYKFLEETTDKDGNKVRTYHKIVTKAVATVNGKEVVLNVKDGIVPTEKIDGYSFSERKVDPKTGDVIYLFKKDGDNSNNGTNTANSNRGASAAGSNNETDVPNSNNGTSKESSNSGTGSENKPLPVVMKDESGNVIKSGLDSSTSKEIPGYKLIREEKDKSGNVVYTYHKIVTKLVALENGKEVVLKDKVGDLTKEDLPGYKFEKEEKSENGDTRFIYSKVSNNNDSSKKTIYKDDSGNVIKQETGVGSNETIPGYKIIGEKIDENGNKIVTYHKIVTKSKSTIDGKEVTLLVKDGLDSNPASIPGFAYSETKTDPETGDLIYYYTDRTPNIGGKLAVYKDEQGNVFLTAKGEIPEVDEKLYKLLKTETDEDGNQVFTYHRIVTNYTTVIDGKEDIIKTNLGETPKEEIPGYKFDKTEKDDKTGDLKQVYTKDLKTADKKEAVKTGASASKIILPIIGLAGLGGLVGFIAKRKSKK